MSTLAAVRQATLQQWAQELPSTWVSRPTLALDVGSKLRSCLLRELTGIEVKQPAAGLRRVLSTAAAGVVSHARAARPPPSLLSNLKQLSKFRLSSLVVLTSSAGFVLGSGEVLDWAALGWTSLGTLGAAACANALNQVYEVTNDRRMARTCNRPLPAARMTRAQALVFAAVAGLTGLAILHTKTNDLTAGLGAANILLYAGVYTPLKQISPVNTWVGAVVGAIPPLMGWASASGTLEPGALVLAAALFSWQMPHFMALAWLCKRDYLRGGFRMVSGKDLTGRATALPALRHAAALVPLGAAAAAAGVVTQPFAWEAAALGAMLLYPAVQFAAAPSQAAARRLFRASLLYLPLLLIAAVVHRLPNTHTLTFEDAQQHVAAAFGGAPFSGVLPLLRAGAERTAASAARLLGSGVGVLGDLRCPSTVHGDDGTGVAKAAAPGVAVPATISGDQLRGGRARSVVVDGDAQTSLGHDQKGQLGLGLWKGGLEEWGSDGGVRLRPDGTVLVPARGERWRDR